MGIKQKQLLNAIETLKAADEHLYIAGGAKLIKLLVKLGMTDILDSEFR